MEVFNSDPLNYVVSLPATGDSSGNGTPVLCFLHGFGESAPMEIQAAITAHGPLRQGSSQIARADFIVVAPQLPAHAQGDNWHKYAEAVRKLVVEVQNKYGGNPRKTYLTGFSHGANGVLDIAQSPAGFWAAIWPVDPTRVPRSAPNCPIWFSMGERSRDSKQRFIERLHLVPTANDPSDDHIFLDQGQDHVGTATLAYQDDQIYTWLKAKHR